MKKICIIIGIAALSLIALLESGVLDSLLIFLLAGQIPGTNYTVPSSFMLLAIISAAWLLVLRFAGFEVERKAPKRKTKRQAERKKRMPKRRYAQILSPR